MTSGSRNAGNWKDKLMCPIGYYASGFTAKFGTLHSKPLGFNGLLLTCTTADLKNSQIVQDNRNGHAQHYDVKNGSFISSFKIKYIEGSYLSGVAFYAEGLPIISSIKINYEISAGFDDYPVTIDSQIISNCDKNTAHKKVGFSKSYETTGQWNSNNPELKGY